MSVADCYARLTTPFAALGPFYDYLGHRGADFDRDARQTVLAYEAGVVEYIGMSGGLGRVLGIRLDGGGFAGWAHLYDIRVGIGERVERGTVLALVAGAGDRPGTLWAGSHIHTTLGYQSALNAALGVRPLADPAPRIRDAIAAPASGIPTTPIQEDDMFTDADRALLQQVRTAIHNTHAGLWSGGAVEIDGNVQRFKYGVLPIVAHNQTLIAQQSARIAALETALAHAGGAVDIAAVVAAAEQGARDALESVGLTADAIADAVVDEQGERLSGP